MAKRSLLCKYCKGTEQFQAEYLGNRMGVRWGVRCQLSDPLPIRSFYSTEEAQRSIDEWCTGDGRRACRSYLLEETKNSYSFGGDLLREFEAMEEATVAKQTYFCKCGRTFQKSSTAQDTGYRMDDYGAEHECYGCPFVEPVTEGWGATQQIKSYECRASSTKINYTTKTDMCIEGHHVVHIYTLDLPWLDDFIRAYLQTSGSDSNQLLTYDFQRLEKAYRGVSLCQGRNTYGFYFQGNKTGTAARKTLFEQFFNEDKTAQMGPGPGGDKERIMHMIEHSKAEAREKALREDDEIFALEEPDKVVSSDSQMDFMRKTLQEFGVAVADNLEREELRNMYNGLLMKRRQAVQPAPEQLPATSTEQEIIPATAPRSIVDVTAEIQLYKAQTVQNYIEIGRRLIEAKAMLEHGQWGIWLSNTVEFSERTARNLMAIAEQYSNRQPVADLPVASNPQALADLSYTKLLALLAVPAEDRDDFINAPHIVDGQEKTVDEMSKRELQKVIKERDEALKLAQDAKFHEKQISESYDRLEQVNKGHYAQRTALETEVRQLKDENRRQRQDIERLESQPRDVAVELPSNEDMERMRQNVRLEVLQEIALPETYLAKKSVEEAAGMYTDLVSGVYAQGILLASQMDRKAARKSVEAYISTMNQYTQQLREKLNLMIYVDRGTDQEVDDFDD